jgi:hypothetical protein
MNYWAYLLDDPVVEPPALLILDDAHLAESPLAGRFSVTVDRTDHAELFESLLGLIAERAPGYPVVDDAQSNATDPATRVQILAFPHVAALADAARQHFERHVPTFPDLRYPYQRLSHALERCLWLVGPDTIQIRPLRYPLGQDPAFADAGRRVYLSATLADLTDLRRRLGVPRMTRLTLSGGDRPDVPGERLLLAFDTELDETMTDVVRQVLTAATPRAVWFCRSKRQADELRAERVSAGRRVIELDREGANLTSFARSEGTDLVIAGRYDGMDFAGDEARLGFFTSAPYGTDPLDSFMADNFPAATFLAARVAERLTQALGRMTRDEHDWAIIVLEGSDFAHLLTRNEIIGWLPDKLYREIESALERSELPALDQAREAAAVLSGDAPLPTTGDYRRPRRPAAGWLDEWADFEATYGDTMWAGTSDGAVAAATRLVNALGHHPLRPWWQYLRAHAAYVSYLDDGRPDRLEMALADLESAVRAAGRTTWFGRVQAATQLVRQQVAGAVEPARAADPVADFARSFTSQARYGEWCRGVSNGLRAGEHDGVARAWTEIGRALGYVATSPGGQSATDSLWRGVDGSFVFEAKIDHAADAAISRREVNQLLGQIEAEENTGNTTYGAFLSHLEIFHEAVGTASARVPIITLDVALAIWDRLHFLLDTVQAAASAGHRTQDLVPPQSWLPRLLEAGHGRALVRADLDHVWPVQR